MTLQGVSPPDSFSLISRLMELANQRQAVIANNMANANTPGYVRMDLDFEEELARVMNHDPSRNPESVRPELVEDLSQPPRRDGNNVVVPLELNRMMQNGLLYSLRAYMDATVVQAWVDDMGG